MSLRIGVVGAGASGVCFLQALRRWAEVPIEVTVFDPAPFLWRGNAYQPDSTVRVNAPPEDMTVDITNPRHFEDWFTAMDAPRAINELFVDSRSGIRFVPRAVYGDYLEQTARAAMLDLMSRGCDVTVVRQGVRRATAVGGGVELELVGGDWQRVDRVVLCVGGGRPADHYGLTGSPGFISDPYPVRGQLTAVPPDAKVAIVGSGLTAVDVVLSLAASEHHGPVTLLSRNGVLPAVRQRPIEYELQYFSPTVFRAMAARGDSCSAEEAVKLMGAELRSAEVDLPRLHVELAASTDEEPRDRLRRQLSQVEDDDLGLRILQKAVPEAGPDVWPLLSDQEKVALLTGYRRTIMSLCCPMPASSAHILLDLMDGGRLRIAQGLLDIHPVASGFQAQDADGFQQFDYVINAMSPPAHRIPSTASELTSSLVKCGLAELHSLGGLHVDRATSQLTVAGRPQPLVHALGDLASGSLFFTFGVPSLVDRAEDIAISLLSQAAWVTESEPAFF